MLDRVPSYSVARTPKVVMKYKQLRYGKSKVMNCSQWKVDWHGSQRPAIFKVPFPFDFGFSFF